MFMFHYYNRPDTPPFTLEVLLQHNKNYQQLSRSPPLLTHTRVCSFRHESPHSTAYTVTTALTQLTINKIFNNSTLLLLKMYQCTVLRLSKPDSFTSILGVVEKPTKFKPAWKRFTSSVSNWTRFLDASYLPATQVHISSLPIDQGEVENLVAQLRQSSEYPILEDSFEHVISLITDLRKATLSENTAKGLHTIESTSALGAYGCRTYFCCHSNDIDWSSSVDCWTGNWGHNHHPAANKNKRFNSQYPPSFSHHHHH